MWRDHLGWWKRWLHWPPSLRLQRNHKVVSSWDSTSWHLMSHCIIENTEHSLLHSQLHVTKEDTGNECVQLIGSTKEASGLCQSFIYWAYGTTARGQRSQFKFFFPSSTIEGSCTWWLWCKKGTNRCGLKRGWPGQCKIFTFMSFFPPKRWEQHAYEQENMSNTT